MKGLIAERNVIFYFYFYFKSTREHDKLIESYHELENEEKK